MDEKALNRIGVPIDHGIRQFRIGEIRGQWIPHGNVKGVFFWRMDRVFRYLNRSAQWRPILQMNIPGLVHFATYGIKDIARPARVVTVGIVT